MGAGLIGASGSTVGAAPTGVAVWDAVLTAVLVAVVVAAAVVVRPAVVVAGLLVVAALAGPIGWSVAAVAAVAALLAVGDHRIARVPVRAAAGAALAHGLLQLRPVGPFGGSSIVAGIVIVSLACFAVAALPSASRRRVVALMGAAATLTVLAVAAAAVAGLTAASRVVDGIDEARTGATLAVDGDPAAAGEHLERSARSFREASDRLSVWWAAPARLVPVVGQHIDAGVALADAAAEVALAGHHLTTSADPAALRPVGGAIDVEALRALEPALADLDVAVGNANTSVGQLDSRWLVRPLRARLDEVEPELQQADDTTAVLVDAARTVPALLGADGPRRYLVLFATPAEAREMGGFVGNLIEVEADAGRVTIGARLRVADLVNAGPGTLPDPDSYPARFLVNRPEDFPQNWTSLADFPTLVRAVHDLYPSMGGQPIDGALYVDPFAVAAIIRATGPVEIPGYDVTLDGDSAAPFLLVDQYELFARDDRVEMLDRLALVVFSRLIDFGDTSPRQLAAELAAAADQGRLRVATLDHDENAFLDTVGLLGAVPPADGADHLAVVHSNAGGDKLDSFLRRRITYRASVEPATGIVQAEVTVELENRIPPETVAALASLPETGPAAGPDDDGPPPTIPPGQRNPLPPIVYGINPDRGIPAGTNRCRLSIYTPHRLESVAVDGIERPVEIQREFGFNRYLVKVDVPAGATVQVGFRLDGSVDTSDGAYRLRVPAQPLANVDELTIDVAAGPARLAEAVSHDETATWELVLG